MRFFPVELGGQDDPGGRVAGFTVLGHGDLSLMVKMGVQFGLVGGAVHRQGPPSSTPAGSARWAGSSSSAASR